MGKTVISLALILSNPAPTLPASGAKTTDLAKVPKAANGQAFWKPSASSIEQEDNEVPSTQNPKRGRYLSRGTLVVCNVSLVGQWIEEAKSKLSDPGLVYSYHGSGRKRDPKILSKNAIVVTTYETLASDCFFHSGKSGSASYCPPM
jgi:SNF2 family DNA or RNA helicase